MAAGQPKTKAMELMEAAVALSEQLHPNAFDMARLKSDAKKLRPSDPFLGSAILGLLAGLERNEPDAEKNFSVALRLRPNEFGVRINYAITLYCLNRYSEAREQALLAHSLNQSHKGGLNKALHFCVITGHFAQAREILERARKLNDQDIDRDDSDVANRGGAYLEERSLAEQDVEQLLETAVAVLKSHRVYADNLYARFLADDEDEWMSLHFHLPLSAKQVTALNEDMAFHLARMEPAPKAASWITTLFLTSAAA